MMEVNEILHHVDHTNLLQNVTWDKIKTLCDQAVKYDTASICIPPCYVKDAAAYLDGKKTICTVIGFPYGYTTTAVKVAEAKEAIENGASEIDMVVNVSWVKSGFFDRIKDEIAALREATKGCILKVIIEVVHLTDAEKIEMCRIITETGADYIKTCTGMSGGRATLHDAELFKKHLGPNVKMKASTGIDYLEDAASMLEAGYDRIGSRTVVAGLDS